MAFEGYLIQFPKTGDVITGESFIKIESFKPKRNIQDLNPYRDANGIMHRNALSHVPIKVEFETRDGITNTELQNFMTIIKNNYTIAKERKLRIKVYIPEQDAYVTQDVYMPDLDPTIKNIDLQNNVVKYKSVRFAFIGY